MFCDYHVHSSISCDCLEPMKNQVERALELGLEEVCFTEHLEINFHRGEEWRTDLHKYLRTIKEMSTSDLRIKFGIEAGTTCDSKDIEALIGDLKSVNFDFVLACAHAVDGADPFMPVFFKGKTRQEVFSGYIEVLREGLKKLMPQYYSAIAHIDFPAKGMRALGLPDPQLRYKDAPEQIDALFREIISFGKCIEINTSTLPDQIGSEIEEWDWVRRYVELGGEYVTFGSDAHTTKRVGHGLKQAMEMARQCGVRYYATYEKMRPIYHKL